MILNRSPTKATKAHAFYINVFKVLRLFWIHCSLPVCCPQKVAAPSDSDKTNNPLFDRTACATT